MEIACMMLASYAETAPDGRISIIGGGIGTIRVVGTTPATMPLPIYLVASVIIPFAENPQEFAFRAELLAPDGSIIENNEQKGVMPPDPGKRDGRLTLNVAFHNVTFPATGEYTVRVILNDKELRKLPLHLEAIGPVKQAEGT